jgi:hypothetical protein
MKNEIDRECGTNGGEERCVQGLVGRLDGKMPLEKRRLRWKDNIKVDLHEVGCGVMDCIGRFSTGTGGGLL